MGMVVIGKETETYYSLCEQIEQISGKRKGKWIKTTRARRSAYMRSVIENPAFTGRLFYADFHAEKDYASCMARAIAAALISVEARKGAVVIIDALPESKERSTMKALRDNGVNPRKVRGLDDENDALIRLSDALCGLVRGAKAGQSEMISLLEQGARTGVIVQLGSC